MALVEFISDSLKDELKNLGVGAVADVAQGLRTKRLEDINAGLLQDSFTEAFSGRAKKKAVGVLDEYINNLDISSYLGEHDYLNEFVSTDFYKGITDSGKEHLKKQVRDIFNVSDEQVMTGRALKIKRDRGQTARRINVNPYTFDTMNNQANLINQAIQGYIKDASQFKDPF